MMDNLKELDSADLVEVQGGWDIIIYLIDNADRAWEGYTDVMKAVFS